VLRVIAIAATILGLVLLLIAAALLVLR